MAASYAAGLLIFAIAVFWANFSSAFGYGILSSVLLFLVSLICTGFGRLILRFFKSLELSESEKTLIGCTLGLGLLSTGIFLLGAAGCMRPWAVMLVLCLMWIFGFVEMKDTVSSFGANRNLLMRDRALWALGLLLILGVSFWTTWVPPHQYDALVYHLPLPAAYVRSGSLSPVSYLIYSHFPQNAEMLSVLGLMMGSDILPQMFSWLALALSVWWVFEMGKREMPASAAMLACVLIASHTSVMLLAGTAYVETFVMLWVTAAVLSYLRWHETAGVGSGRGWLVLSGIFAGLGIGTKYTAGISAVILSLFLLFRWTSTLLGARQFRNSSIKDALAFAGVVIIAACPWLIKNWIVVGNPIFPFLYNVLPHHGSPWGSENATRYFHALVEYQHAPGHFFSDLAQVPYLMITGSTNLGGGMDALGILGWAVLFGLLPAAIWASSKNSSLRWVGVYCALHFVAWFSSRVVLRFLTAIIPLVFMIEAAGFYRTLDTLRGRWRVVLGTGLALLIACNFAQFLYIQTLFRSWGVLLGTETRDEFLGRLDYYPCARWAQDALDKNDKILIVGEQRSFYVKQDVVATTPMAPNPFVEWANQASSTSDLSSLLKAKGGFTHLLMVPREAQRLGGYGIFSFTDKGFKNWTGLFEKNGTVKSIFSGPNCSVMKIE